MTMLTEEQFEEVVLRSTFLVLVSLGHEASGASYLLQQRLRVLEACFEDQIQCYHLKLDPTSTFLTTFNIAYLPCLLIFQAGELIEQCQTSLPLHRLQLKVKELTT